VPVYEYACMDCRKVVNVLARRVSDDQAKKHIPGNETAFTQDEIGILAEVREIFGIKAVEVKKYGTGKQAGN